MITENTINHIQYHLKYNNQLYYYLIGIKYDKGRKILRESFTILTCTDDMNIYIPQLITNPRISKMQIRKYSATV